MGHPSAEQLAQRAHDMELLDERQIREIWAALGSRSVPWTTCCNCWSAAST